MVKFNIFIFFTLITIVFTYKFLNIFQYIQYPNPYKLDTVYIDDNGVRYKYILK